MELPPLLVTLAMDDASFAHFNAERIRYFPPERNHIPAHITLFHKLPGEEEEAVRRILAVTAHHQRPFTMHTTGLWMIGFGVAYLIENADAQVLRAQLQQQFKPWLSPQDAKQGFRPHITVQNKTTATAAKALHAELSQVFLPRAVQAVGLDLWRYLGGPWEHRARFDFGA